MGDRWFIAFFAAACSCGSSWDPEDPDGDGYTSLEGDCWENTRAGPEGTDLQAEDIHPDAYEYCDTVDNDCDGQVDEDAFLVAVEVDPGSGACSDGYGGVHAEAFEWGVTTGCETRWYIACNSPDASIRPHAGVFDNDACAEAQASNSTWPLEADPDDDGVWEPVTTCGWLMAE